MSEKENKAGMTIVWSIFGFVVTLLLTGIYQLVIH